MLLIIVSRVGKDTLYGKMAIEMSLGDDRDSPLQFKLSALAETISKIGYIGATSIALSFLFKQFIMDQGWDLAQTMMYLTGSPLKALKDATSALTLGFYFTFNLTLLTLLTFLTFNLTLLPYFSYFSK